jgi:hypothetical protein
MRSEDEAWAFWIRDSLFGALVLLMLRIMALTGSAGAAT